LSTVPYGHGITITPVCTHANEAYNPCGSACPPTCATKDTPQICTQQCVAEFQCNTGFYRAANGECLTYAQCS
ncbi:hypothetical protein PMAYCL1PPCAC_09119, partial [Pristionchus mayeri]